MPSDIASGCSVQRVTLTSCALGRSVWMNCREGAQSLWASFRPSIPGGLPSALNISHSKECNRNGSFVSTL